MTGTRAALGEITGCVKTYVMQFAEAEGLAGTHFHVVPRSRDLPPERPGSGTFWYLSRPDPEHVQLATRDDLAGRLTLALARRLS